MDLPNIRLLKDRSKQEIFTLFRSNENGLTEIEAQARHILYGANEIKEAEKMRPLKMLFSKFKNPILLVLLTAAAVSAMLGSPTSSVIIVVMVFMSVGIDFVNTYKSAKAAERLRNQVRITTAVVRGGVLEEKNIHEVVPGDIVELRAGDIVPADCILFAGRDLFINESTLTGESMPAEKLPEGDSNQLFMGTSVVSGEGRGVAVAIGANTRFGQIALQVASPDEETEFDRDLKKFSAFLFKVIFALVAFIIIANIFFQHKGYFETFLFAVAIAVGLTPELLPVIVSANLARGAVKMSKSGVIVKKLSAIHDFGSIDILCTDKTGTLTEDKIELVKYVDGEGRDSNEVLYWGYVNSMLLSGVKGAMDRAVDAFHTMDISAWKKLDEVPFDFERRRDSVVVGGVNAKFGVAVTKNQALVISKGAPEEIFKICTRYKGRAFTKTAEKKVNEQYEKLSSEGFRVLGLAVRTIPLREGVYSKEDESGMTFLGFLAFYDPPKKSASATLRKMTEHGIEIKIVTGDNHFVTERIAREIGLPIKGILNGNEVEAMDDEQLCTKAIEVNIFTRVDPDQKRRIIQAFKTMGHVVGYMGDGVNDLPPLKHADVGISVNNAMDVAKDTADIILLKKGLDVLLEGVLEGRKTFANIFKYLMMTLSSNFGNMMSMPVASVFLPFLPMTPPQILLNNTLYDSSELAIPFDSTDPEFLRKPKKFNVKFLWWFMVVFGPASSLFDIATFLVLYYGWHLAGPGFQTGWFIESFATQALVVNIIRTRRSIFETRPGLILLASSIGFTFISWILPYTALGPLFGFERLSWKILLSIAVIVVAYLMTIEFIKHRFYERWGHLQEK